MTFTSRSLQGWTWIDLLYDDDDYDDYDDDYDDDEGRRFDTTRLYSFQDRNFLSRFMESAN